MRTCACGHLALLCLANDESQRPSKVTADAMKMDAPLFGEKTTTRSRAKASRRQAYAMRYQTTTIRDLLGEWKGDRKGYGLTVTLELEG
ncbi:MAG: hypothetical protein F4X62_10160 [Caldilineaceae bacterium SB0662_bin_25]|nr:hypothetical protein [Caldilineaceae bacterium SB0662_bin_25]